MQNSIKHTAYHEAGHALVAMYTAGADPLHKATINPRGDALGLTWQIPPTDEYSRSLTQLRASIDVAMGGQVAETLVFGSDNVGAGATSDLKHATGLARHMVCDCGFSDVIGPMTVDDASAPTTRQAADKEVWALPQPLPGLGLLWSASPCCSGRAVDPLCAGLGITGCQSDCVWII